GAFGRRVREIRQSRRSLATTRPSSEYRRGEASRGSTADQSSGAHARPLNFSYRWPGLAGATARGLARLFEPILSRINCDAAALVRGRLCRPAAAKRELFSIAASVAISAGRA